MKTHLLIIRHAKSIANENGMFGGITDYPLSEVGSIQAEDLSKRLKKYEIDKIYSSPLKRAKQTITPYAKSINKDIIIVDDLIEINVGSWEDQPRDELRKKFPEVNRKIDETEFYTGMNGQEETKDVSNRMFNAITELAKENGDKTIVIVSHVVAIRAFLCKILNIPFEETKSKIGNLGNTSVTRVDYDLENNEYNVVELGSMK